MKQDIPMSNRIMRHLIDNFINNISDFQQIDRSTLNLIKHLIPCNLYLQ